MPDTDKKHQFFLVTAIFPHKRKKKESLQKHSGNSILIAGAKRAVSSFFHVESLRLDGGKNIEDILKKKARYA